LTHRARVLLLLLASAIVLASIAAGAQPAKVPRIGYVAGGPLPFREGFRQGLRELGYVEGQNVLVEYRWTGGRAEVAQELLAELVASNVDVIVAVGPPPVYAAKRATTTIPIVMVAVVEPAAAGLVASLARPGGNLTGLAFDVSPEIVRKLLELLKEAAPRFSRAVVLWNPANPGDRPYVTELQAAAAALRVPLAIVEVRTPKGLIAPLLPSSNTDLTRSSYFRIRSSTSTESP
jgi:putative ABC transport system substrate-binding protein